ncbi:MAG: glycosyltransferase family 39 protein [Planctomycetes bacterium]|jgi:hypothetical protein|nr:glycosyltransferase family 39 protein [Planctomycetota bacterium]
MPRSLLWLALLCHLVLAGSYAAMTPSFEGPDENSHYEYAQFLAHAGTLPLAPGLAAARGLPQTDGAVLAHHPPLYYALLAGMLRALGRADTVFGPLEHADFGNPASPARHLHLLHGNGQGEGVLLLLRLLSVALGAMTIVCVHRLGRRCCPNAPRVADLAALLVACLPMFSFLHGVLNSDVLATTLAAAVLLRLVKLLQTERIRARTGLLLGALLGAALLTKLTALFLLPLTALTFAVAWWQRRDRTGDRGPLVAAGVLTLVAALATSGWWFVRNAQLYGDPLALSVHDAAFQPIPPELRWSYLLGTEPWPASVPSFLPTVFTSLLGQFGWFSLPPPRALLWLAATVTALAAVGIALATVPRQRKHWPRPAWLLWVAALLVFAGTAQFNWKAPQPQGRLLFPALGPAAVLLAAGLVQLSASLRWRRWLLPLLPATALVVLFGWFRPAFAPQLAPAPAWHRALVGDIVTPPNAPTLRWAIGLPAASVAPPTLRWEDPGAPADTRYTLYAFEPNGRVRLASHEWSHGRVVLQGTEVLLPDAIWSMLPSDVDLQLRLRRIPTRADEDPATLPHSPPLPFRRETVR